MGAVLEKEVDDFLEHYGVEGMRWGVRKDKKWGKRLLSTKGYFEVHNHAADKMNNGGIARFNARPEFKNMKGTSDPRYGKYVSDYEKLFAQTMDQSLRESGQNVSPSGRFVASVNRSPGSMPVITIKDTQLEHAADSMPLEFSYELVLDSDGYVTSVKKRDSMEQSVINPTVDAFLAQYDVDPVDAFLAHYGVLGMHWGVRRQRRTARLARAGAPGSTVASRARVFLTGRTGPIDLIRGRGIRGAAKRKSTRELARFERLKTGRATVRDQIIRFGSTRLEDFFAPVKTANLKKPGGLDNDYVALTAVGAAWVASKKFGDQAVKTKVTKGGPYKWV